MIQDIGSQFCTTGTYASGQLNFSKKGNKLAIVSAVKGIVDVFDFNRCTGLLSNHRNIIETPTFEPYSSEFSPEGRFLYVSFSAGFFSGSSQDTQYLYQYDLTNFNRYEVWNDGDLQTNNYYIGQLKLGPDNKIYMAYSEGSTVLNFNQYTSNLSYISQPDSLGTACDFRPFEFHLGDSAYVSFGLPNMPNYNLESVTMDTCITVGINENNSNNIDLKVYPNPTQNILHIKPSSQNQQINKINIIDINGRNVVHANQSPINTSELTQGIYFYQVEMRSGELVRGKFVKE